MMKNQIQLMQKKATTAALRGREENIRNQGIPSSFCDSSRDSSFEFEVLMSSSVGKILYSGDSVTTPTQATNQTIPAAPKM